MSKLVTSDNLKAYHSELAEHLQLLERDKAYSVGDTVKYDGLTLKCTIAGNTDVNKVDYSSIDIGDTIVDGTVTFTVIDPNSMWYEEDKFYMLDDIVVYNDKFYKCITAHTATATFDTAKWTEISAGGGGSSGGGISIWQANTAYNVDDIVIDSNLIWKCAVSHTSTTTFDESKWVCISGGEVSNGMEIVPLWEGSFSFSNSVEGATPTSSTPMIELSDSIQNYEYIYVVTELGSGSDSYAVTVPVSLADDIRIGMSAEGGIYSTGTLSKYDNTHFYMKYNNTAYWQPSNVVKICGIRKAKPIVSSGMKYETLWEGEAGSFGDNDTASISLSDPIIKYQKIGIEVTCRHDSTQYRNYYREIDVASFVNFLINHQSNETFSITWGLDSKFDYVDFNYSSTTIQLEANLCRSQVKKVIGISEGVQIPTGVQAARVTLWEGFYNTVNGTVTLTDSIENYDMFEVYGSNSNSLGEKALYIFSCKDINYTDTYQFRTYNSPNSGNNYYSFSFSFVDANNFRVDAVDVSNNSWAGAGIYRIVGIKYIQPDSYSTEEKLIGTWIDGKPLYRKVFENVSNSANLNMPNTDYTVIKIYGCIFDISFGNIMLPNEANYIYINPSGLLQTNKQGVINYVVVEYTKI